MSLKFNMCEGEMLMRTEDLEKITPYTNGVWDKENLIEYLIWKCDRRFSTWIDDYFSSYLNDWQLAEYYWYCSWWWFWWIWCTYECCLFHLSTFWKIFLKEKEGFVNQSTRKWSWSMQTIIIYKEIIWLALVHER